MLFVFSVAALLACSPSGTPAAAHLPQQPAPAKAAASRKGGAIIKTGRCDQPRAFNFPAQRFDETAQAIAHATGCFIKYDNQDIAAVRVNPIKGKMTLRQALRTALRGTKLGIVRESADQLEVAPVAGK